jgi:hypothetical protein
VARIALFVTLFFAFPIFCVADEKEEKAKETRALTQSQILLRTCEAFKIHPGNEGSRYPVALLNLKKPPWGGGSYIDNEKDLLDPWGKPFHYGVAVDEKGNVQTYVWSERKVDGKTKVIGTKLPEPEPKKK